METSFKQSLAWVRVSEGGNDDDPADAGGRTSRGVTQREDNAYHEMAGLPLIDVWKETDEIIDDIYHRSYWLPYGPVLPAGPDYMFFDHCVLAGPAAAIKCLQRSLGVAADGHIGVVTSAALAKTDPAKLIDAMAADRTAYYRAVVAAHPQDRKFYRGWTNRVAFATRNAHMLVKVDAGRA